ncbi:MAG TPA: glycoside hydrolase family 13 protein [Gaiellaceae bacterium]|jgi:alpha-glucosidase|nr:glycoside hydrolase family 13 protein [Gaiellaceae bacterium]
MSEWWRNAVFYEIYVRSFADANGDGVGDLEGIRAHLPHLRNLGVDAIWLTPFYPSPGADHGYDVSDYVDVDPLFGTLDDFDALVRDAHALELRVIADIVPNHSSSEHPWFKNALADPSHPDRARYIFRPGRGDRPPNNWPSNWGGPAWTKDEASGEWYLHLFAPEQPDLDWHTKQVRDDFDDILRFWLARGIDGFRIDVAAALYKDATLRDELEPFPDSTFSTDWRRAVDQPEVHDVYRNWRRMVAAYDHDPVLVGEVVFSDPVRMTPYLRDDELHMAFNFTLLFQDWNAEAMRNAIDTSLAALADVSAPPTWVLENHDVTRLPTRYGGGDEGLRRARAAALLLLALPGPVYLYQGQELGLEEVDLPDEVRQDPIFHRMNGERLGRDGCRVPLPWENDAPGFGFTTGSPWLPIPDSWEAKTVERQHADGGSMFMLYRSALALRPQLQGDLSWQPSPPGTLVFDRGDVRCIVNVDGEPLELDRSVLLASEAIDDVLPPGAAVWLR